MKTLSVKLFGGFKQCLQRNWSGKAVLLLVNVSIKNYKKDLNKLVLSKFEKYTP